MSLPFSYLGAVGFQIPPQPLVEEAPSIPTPFWQLDASWTQLGPGALDWATQGNTRAVAKAILKKNPPTNAGDARDAGSIPGLGRSPGVGNSNPL